MIRLSICLKFAALCLGLTSFLSEIYAQSENKPYPATDSFKLSIPVQVSMAHSGSEQTLISSKGRQYVKRVSRSTLLAYDPSAEKPQNRAAILICPGGGYAQLMIEDEGAEVARYLNKVNVVTFVLKYSTSENGSISDPKIPLAEAQEAIALIRKHAAEWHIDSSKIGIMGFSAGGHLAALSAVKFEHPQHKYPQSVRPDFTVLIYPVISFLDSLTSNRSKTRTNLLGPHPSLSTKQWFSPEIQLDSNTPPAFIVHAENDSTALVQNSIAYYHGLVKNNIPAKAIFYEKGGHGFGIFNQAEKRSWLKELTDWMKLNQFLTPTVAN